MSLADFNLSEDAFPLTPSAHVDESWYGFKSIKRQYQEYTTLSLENSNRLVVLNRGRFGAGKTHAARFTTKRLSKWKGNEHYSQALSFIIENPKGQKNAFYELTVRLLDAIDSQLLIQSSRDLVASKGSSQAKQLLRQLTQSEDISEALVSLNDENRLSVMGYLRGSSTAKELRLLNVSRKLSQSHDFAAGLVGVLSLLIHGIQGSKPRRIFLWIDEMEDLIYFSSANYLPFTQALRDLLDRLSKDLSVMANFTFSEPEDLPSIKEVLGGAIMDRVNQHLIMGPPTADEIAEYLTDLLMDNRINPELDIPISESGIARLGELCKGKTPRYVNKACAYLFTKSPSQAKKPKSGPLILDESQIEQQLPGIIQELDEATI
jgi:hypothetical protein